MTAAVPRLHLVGPLGRASDVDTYVDIAGAAVAGGVGAVHVRLPGRTGNEVLNLTRRLVSLETAAAVIVNDRLDVALLTKAAGVQLGEQSIPVADARHLLGASSLIGRSVHDLPGAQAAQSDGADYVIAGHVFDTESKSGQPGRGLEWLAEICTGVQIPVLAIGGINASRVRGVMQAGAWGVAVGREVLDAADPCKAAQRLASELQ